MVIPIVYLHKELSVLPPAKLCCVQSQLTGKFPTISKARFQATARDALKEVRPRQLELDAALFPSLSHTAPIAGERLSRPDGFGFRRWSRCCRARFNGRIGFCRRRRLGRSTG